MSFIAIADGASMNKKFGREGLKERNPNAIHGICGLYRSILHMINRVIDLAAKDVDSFSKTVAFCKGIYNLFLYISTSLNGRFFATSLKEVDPSCSNSRI